MYYLLFFIIFVVTLLVLVSRSIITMRTKSSSVNESAFLTNKPLRNDIYIEDLKNDILCPINLKIEPMSKLILFDVEDDPLYSTIELQEFDDNISNGIVIILYRKDKEIDVYYTKGIEHDFYKGSKNGTSQLIIPDDYIFEKTSDKLTFILKFYDKNNNKIFVEAIEKNSKKEHFNILAPAGDMIDNFTTFPLFYMQETAFLERNYAKIDIEIAGKKRKPVSIPIAINGKFVFLSRYSLDPVVCSFNENFIGTMNDTNSQKLVDYQVQLSKNSSRNEIEALTCCKYNHKATIKFSPPIPELLSLKNNTKIKGRFSASVDSTSGILGGDYLIRQDNGELQISIMPKKGWQPMPGKKWFKKFIWVSTISKGDKGLSFNSQWVYDK